MCHWKLIPAMLLLLASAPVSAEALGADKKAAIERLMEVSGAGQTEARFADAFVEQSRNMFAAANPGMPPRVLAIVAQEARAVLDARLAGDHGLFAAVYPVYHKHFSLAEIEALVAFYRSPAGQKALRVMPQVTMEAMRAGQRWSQSAAHAVQIRVEQRLAAEGLR